VNGFQILLFRVAVALRLVPGRYAEGLAASRSANEHLSAAKAAEQAGDAEEARRLYGLVREFADEAARLMAAEP
jgi:hypothetical protein